jgi:O-antigen ligase
MFSHLLWYSIQNINVKQVSYMSSDHIKDQISSEASNRPFTFTDRIYLLFKQILLYFTLTLLILTPIFRGLYFTREWQVVHYLTLALFIPWLLFWLVRKKAPFAFQPIDFVALALPIFYLIALFGAVNPTSAVAELFKMANYIAVYLIVRTVLAGRENRSRYTMLIIDTAIIAGTLVAITGIAGASGALQIPTLFDGSRIHGPLQYHNANGVYLSALFLLSLGPALTGTNYWARLPYFAAGFVTLLTVILTFSRGAWLALALCCLFMVFFSVPGNRLRTAFYIFIPAAIAYLSVAQFEAHFAAKTGPAVFLLLAGLSALVCLLIFLGELALKRIKPNINSGGFTIILLFCLLLTATIFPNFVPASAPGRPYAQTAVAAVSAVAPSAVACAASSTYLSLATNASELVAPPADSVHQRVSEINLEAHSVTERFIYYRTALKIFRDYPLKGAGGGAWPALYPYYLTEEHPNFMHTVEVHSYYLQVLIEAGIPALLTLLALWFLFALGFLRYRFSSASAPVDKQLSLAVFSAALMIGAHSAIDFGLSLGAIALLLWILFAVGVTFFTSAADSSEPSSEPPVL